MPLDSSSSSRLEMASNRVELLASAGPLPDICVGNNKFTYRILSFGRIIDAFLHSDLARLS